MTLILTFVAVVNWLKLLDYLLLMFSLGLKSAPILSLKTLNTMLLLQIIAQDLHDFILYIISLASSLLIACLKSLWEDNLVQRFNVFKLMEEVSSSHQFENYLAQHGILPHTLTQNGLVERRHITIVEIGLTLLFHSKVPNEFWL